MWRGGGTAQSCIRPGVSLGLCVPSILSLLLPPSHHTRPGGESAERLLFQLYTTGQGAGREAEVSLGREGKQTGQVWGFQNPTKTAGCEWRLAGGPSDSESSSPIAVIAGYCTVL